MKKYILLQGGLGNQMFQYAFYKSLLVKGYVCILDGSFFKHRKAHTGYRLEECFNIVDMVDSLDHYNYFYRGIYKLFSSYSQIIKPLIYFEDITCFNSENDYKNSYIVSGYWQSYHYFDTINDLIEKDFNFNNINKQANLFSQHISKINSVAVHVRRGDYLSLSVYENLSTTNYYKNAIEYVYENVENPFFYVFSDDINWCKTNFKTLFNHNVCYVDYCFKDYEEMYIMSKAPTIIMANSSFSWWASYLGGDKLRLRPERNITGGRWNTTRDEMFYPKEWIKISL